MLGPKNITKVFGQFTHEVSFETDEMGTFKHYFDNMRVKIRKARTTVTKALAATDDGTVTLKNAAGTAMTSGVVTIAASAAVGDDDVATPTANVLIGKGSYMQFTTAKATAGGRAMLTVEYEVVKS